MNVAFCVDKDRKYTYIFCVRHFSLYYEFQPWQLREMFMFYLTTCR